MVYTCRSRCLRRGTRSSGLLGNRAAKGRGNRGDASYAVFLTGIKGRGDSIGIVADLMCLFNTPGFRHQLVHITFHGCCAWETTVSPTDDSDSSTTFVALQSVTMLRKIAS